MDYLDVITSRVGFFTRRQAAEAGYDDRAVTRLVRNRTWTRIRRGFYAFTNEWTALDEPGRHRVLAGAVIRSLGPAVALSHVSGAVLHGMSTWGLDLSRVHVTRLDGASGRIEGDVVHHEGVCIDGDVIEVEGLPVLRPERCALEAASRVTPEVAMCLFDNGLHRQLFDKDQLSECHQVLQFWPHMRHLHVPIRLADPGPESVGESRGKWLCRMFHLPMPLTQIPVRDAHGELIGTCDWGWPEHKLLGEFDGRIKYGRLLHDGQHPGDVVFAEKQREDRLREASGCAMVRVVWADYDRPRLTAQRIERLLTRAS